MKSKEKKCSCHWCKVMIPKITKIKEAISDESTRKDFEDIVCMLMTAEEDSDVYKAKLDGDWPGWEFMKLLGFSKKFKNSKEWINFSDDFVCGWNTSRCSYEESFYKDKSEAMNSGFHARKNFIEFVENIYGNQSK